MRFIEAEIDEVCRKQQKHLKDELTRFMNMNIKSAKVIFSEDDYSCARSAMVSLRRGAMTHSLPIEAKIVNGNVYLIRTDL